MQRSDTQDNLDVAARLVAQEFQQRYGVPLGTFRAPGRVNLIGEHTDYNDGFVMPAALPYYTTVACGTRGDRKLSVHSLDFGEERELELEELTLGPTGHWSDYVRGVAAVLRLKGIPLRGANLVIKGEVPIGAGLSSSAAIEVATALALLAVAGVNLDRGEIAAICQQAEHQFAGTQCGIMDQFISCFGQANHALLLDCRSLDYELLAVPAHARIVICNTMVKHELAAGEYNRRRADCESGVQFLQSFLPGIRALRDVSLSQLVELGSEMPDRIYRRCRHVVSENARTLEAAAALESGNIERFGVMMGQSHTSLQADYEVSCGELDLLVELANQCQGVFGSRMTGGGFGGCTVNLVDSGSVEPFKAELSRQYESVTGIAPEVYICHAADGAGQVKDQSE